PPRAAKASPTWTTPLADRSSRARNSAERPSLDDSRPLSLGVRSFVDGAALGDRPLAHVDAWNAAGRPGTAGLRIVAYPIDGTYRPSPGEVVVDKQWTRLVLSW